jgi:uncharacterized protein (UPF0261 family)
VNQPSDPAGVMAHGAVYLVATLDSKGAEAAFVRDRLSVIGIPVRVVDVSGKASTGPAADIPREHLFGAHSVAALDRGASRAEAVALACEGIVRVLSDAHGKGQVLGVIGLGGSAGTAIGTAGMRCLPIGVPKIMVSSLASGQVGHYVGESDIMMLNAVVDMAGINRISRVVLSAAANAMAGMVHHRPTMAVDVPDERPIIAMTMFGVTTPCVTRAQEVLRKAGYDALVFHATGAGGRAMESMVKNGFIAGVLDLTTTEIADECVGGVLSAGPSRLGAAALAGIPQVVSVGATDMVNFHGRESLPEQFRNRHIWKHDEHVTLMRTDRDECTRIGETIGRKVAVARGPTVVLLPTLGVSALDGLDRPFDDPHAREALFSAIEKFAGSVPVLRISAHINDGVFAELAAQTLIKLMSTCKSPES